MEDKKYIFIHNGKLESRRDKFCSKAVLSSSELLYRRLKVLDSRKNHKELIEGIINDACCKKEKEYVEKMLLAEEKSKKRPKISYEKLPITRRQNKQHVEVSSLLPLLPVRRKPLVTRFYNEKEEKQIAEAFKEAKKIRESFHLAFKYSQRDGSNNPRNNCCLSTSNNEQIVSHETGANLVEDETGKRLRIIVTLPYVKQGKL